MAYGLLSTYLVAHFAPESLAHIQPELVAQFRPEWVAQIARNIQTISDEGALKTISA